MPGKGRDPVLPLVPVPGPAEHAVQLRAGAGGSAPHSVRPAVSHRDIQPVRQVHPGDAILCVWGAGVLTVLRMVRAGENTDDLERSARRAIALATKADQ